MISSIFNVFHPLRNTNRTTICYATSSPYRYDTDTPPPPTTPTDPKCFGSYCIKSTIDLFDLKNNTEVYTISGYDDNIDIQNKVKRVCNGFITNDKEFACVNEKLVFLGPKENCNGRITVYDCINNKEFFF